MVRPGSGSLARIHRDVRFGKDRRPYKNWVGIVFWATPGKRMTTPAYYFGPEPTGARFHVGRHGFHKPVLAAYRDAVAGPAGAKPVKTLDSIKANRGYGVENPLCEGLSQLNRGIQGAT